jgi:hypothetical protein
MESRRRVEGAARAMSPAVLRQYLLYLLGAVVFVYAVYPPLKAPYLTMAGALLGLDPMFKAAQ